MTLFGGMSKGERTRIKTRVRAAMSAQTATEGRFLGGRPPYGYRLVDAGPHPHPGKAAVGARLHQLSPTPPPPSVVARIFELFLAGHGCYAIAEQLTAEAIPSPAGYDRARHPPCRTCLGQVRGSGDPLQPSLHRVSGVGTPAPRRSTPVRQRCRRRACLPMRWNDTDRWIWSTKPTHQPLVDQATYQAAQARIAARSPHSPRTPRTTPRPYLLRGRLHCALCQRRLQGQWIRGEAYYRCRYPVEYAAASGFQHPKSVYLREVDLVGRLDDWLADLFSPANLDHTCQTLATASRSDPASHRGGPPSRCWPTANAAWTATGPLWRPAPTLPSCSSGSPRSPPPGPPPKPNSGIRTLPLRGSRPSSSRPPRTGRRAGRRPRPKRPSTPYPTLRRARHRRRLRPQPPHRESSTWSSVGVLVVSEGGLEPPRPMRALGPQPGNWCLPRPA